MRSIWKDIATSIFMGMIMPGLILNGTAMVMDAKQEPEPGVQETAPETVPLPMHLRSDGLTQQRDMDGYLVGVVLAEMPASFELEALKAQAVVARTYTQKAYVTGGKHGDGSVCTASSCCQAYISEADYLQQGGTQEGLEKVRSAVLATSGQVLTYEGELIEATYFSCSGGSTEDAVAVWGTNFPYLQAVESPGEEDAAHFMDTATFTAGEFAAALGADLQGTPGSWFGMTTYTEGGGVAEMLIGGEPYSGTALRSALGLRSTAFTVAVEAENIVITTRGYGHRVGMSQYGADAMAAAGHQYPEILAHYYAGTVLTRIDSPGAMG